MASGRIVLLNGPSSAGKTTLAQAVARRLATPWLVLPVDLFHQIRTRPDADLTDRQWHDVFHRTRAAYHRALVGAASSGMPVLADHVLNEPWRLDDLLRLTAGLDVLLVHVTARRRSCGGARSSAVTATRARRSTSSAWCSSTATATSPWTRRTVPTSRPPPCSSSSATHRRSAPSTGSGRGGPPVLEPPPGVDDADVLAEVRRAWDGDVDRVAYQPVGFGAHHWAAYVGAEPRLFVTYDEPQGPEAAADLEAAYAGAVALRDGGLEFVLAPLAAATRAAAPCRSPAVPQLLRRGVTARSGRPLDPSGRRRSSADSTPPPPPPGLPTVATEGRPRLRRDHDPVLTRQEWGPGPLRRHRPRRRPRPARRHRALDRSATTTSPTSPAAVPGSPRTASRTAATSC